MMRTPIHPVYDKKYSIKQDDYCTGKVNVTHTALPPVLMILVAREMMAGKSN